MPPKMRTFRDELLHKYNQISFDPEVDSSNLNEEFADVLIQSESLRQEMLKKGKWQYEDFEFIAKTLKGYGFTYWEVAKIFEAYSPSTWESLGEDLHRKIAELLDNASESLGAEFSLDLEISPFRVSTLGIEKHYELEYGGKKSEGWEIITNTPIVLTSIGECVDDGSYKYQIKYKTVTGQVSKRWVEPKVLLTSDIKELVNLGLQFTDTDQRDLKQYFKRLTGYARTFPKEFTAYKNGWKKDNNVLITGSYAHSGNGKMEILSLTDEIAVAYQVKGNKREWIEVLALPTYSKTPLLDYDLIRLKCYATVAAFLIRFIGVNTFIVHNFYESSGLKSVSMQLASSLVGNPLELIKDADSTKVGIERTLEYNTDTPVYYDETSNNKDFANHIYMIGNEQGKGRGKKDGGIEKAGRWKSVVQTTGELPLSKGQSTNTGQQIRVLEIYEGIPRIEADYIERVKNTIEENYGLFLDEIIQTIFYEKDKLKHLYKQIGLFFEKPATVFADRAKNYFIALAVGGFILEEVFEKNGIPKRDPIDICKSYYQKVVVEDPTIPYYVRALDTVYSWHLRNKKFFEYSRDLDPEDRQDTFKGALELKGWITKDAIYYDPDKLEEYLTSKGFNFERVIEDWKNNSILEPRQDKDPKTGKLVYKSYKAVSTINGQRIKGIKIPFNSLRKVLEIRDEDIQDMRTGNEKENVEEYNVNLINSASQFLNENPELKNVTYSSEQVTDMFIRSKDREELLLHGKEEIVKAFEICKKHK